MSKFKFLTVTTFALLLSALSISPSVAQTTSTEQQTGETSQPMRTQPSNIQQQGTDGTLQTPTNREGLDNDTPELNRTQPSNIQQQGTDGTLQTPTNREGLDSDTPELNRTQRSNPTQPVIDDTSQPSNVNPNPVRSQQQNGTLQQTGGTSDTDFNQPVRGLW